MEEEADVKVACITGDFAMQVCVETLRQEMVSVGRENALKVGVRILICRMCV